MHVRNLKIVFESKYCPQESEKEGEGGLCWETISRTGVSGRGGSCLHGIPISNKNLGETIAIIALYTRVRWRRVQFCIARNSKSQGPDWVAGHVSILSSFPPLPGPHRPRAPFQQMYEPSLAFHRREDEISAQGECEVKLQECEFELQNMAASR